MTAASPGYYGVCFTNKVPWNVKAVLSHGSLTEIREEEKYWINRPNHASNCRLSSVLLSEVNTFLTEIRLH